MVTSARNGLEQNGETVSYLVFLVTLALFERRTKTNEGYPSLYAAVDQSKLVILN